jgi:hypothetical protein
MWIFLAAVLLQIAGCTTERAAERATQTDTRAYTNPVVRSNTPDPGVLATTADGPPFVAVTSSGFEIDTDVFPLRTSADLVHWQVELCLCLCLYPRSVSISLSLSLVL